MNTVFLFCLICVGGLVQDDPHALAMKGGKLSAAEAAVVEKTVTETPDNINARTTLLGYSWKNKRSDPVAKASHVRHVLWLVNNSPKSKVLGLPYSQVYSFSNLEDYGEIKNAWMVHLEEEPVDFAVLKNAAKWFLQRDRELAEKTLIRGQETTSEDPYWDKELGQLYSLNMIGVESKKQRIALATKAFEHYEMAYDFSIDSARDSILAPLAKTAFEAGKTDEAKRYAEEMLSRHGEGWNSGNLIHHGNIIMGRIALAADDIDEAKRRLLAAGKTEGSPKLGSFGPTMVLAKELLEKDETEVVLEYFELCRDFWDMGEERLDQWVKIVEDGDVPSFGFGAIR